MDTNSPQGTYPLDELNDLTVASGDPDPRGWDVYSSDDRRIGKVKDLLVDTEAMMVRYLDVELEQDVVGESDRHILVPVGTARLDDDDDRVLLQSNALSAQGMPAYIRGGAVNRDYEDALLDGARSGAATAGTQSDYYGRPEFDASSFYGTRSTRRQQDDDSERAGAMEGERRLTLSEEELQISKKRVSAGEVELRKRVDTQHARETVPLAHEEVVVERRPVSDRSNTGADIGEDEIRVPLMAEELVVEKRVVPKEELVIRKKVVTADETVEADLRTETLDYDEGKLSAQRHRSGADEVEGGRKGLGDRLGDAVDDMKDRIDGNPASRPGRDETDRPGR